MWRGCHCDGARRSLDLRRGGAKSAWPWWRTCSRQKKVRANSAVQLLFVDIDAAGAE
jgi:hypothetical protein